MTQVDFYILNTDSNNSRLRFICRITDKAIRAQNHVFINTANEEDAHNLNKLLWTFSPGSFIPHALIDKKPVTPPIEPVIISLNLDQSNNNKAYQAKNNFQLAIYQLAVQQNFTDCKRVVLNWYFLRTNNIISVEHNQNKIKELNNNIIKEIINIKYDKEFLPKESLLCEWCYNWEECSIKSTGNPAYKLH